MRRQIPKSDHGLQFDNPSMIESKKSLVPQFLFYFLFLISGIFGAYGCFYTTFSLPLMVPAFIFYAIAFCAVFTIMFLTKPNLYLLLILSLAASVYVFFLKKNLINVLVNQFTQGYFIAYNAVVSAYARKTQYSLITFPIAPASPGETAAFSTMFAVFTSFFFIFLMAWILIRRKNILLCFIFTAPFLAVSVIFGIMPSYTAVGALYIFWAFLIFNSSFLRNKSKFNKKKGTFYSGVKTTANPQSLILLPVLAACLIIVTFLFPTDSFKRSDFIQDMRVSLLNVPRIPSPIQIPIQSILKYTDRVNLQLMGDITFTGKTVLRVKSSSSEGDYLKGFVGSIYTGHSWDPLPEKEYEKLDSILNECKVQNFYSLFNKLLGRPAKTYDLTVRNVKVNSLRVYAPYGLVSTPEELPDINFINDGVLRSDNALFGTSEYSMTASPLQIYELNLSDSILNSSVSKHSSFAHAATEYKSFVYSHYTQLPEELEEKLRQYLKEHNLDIKNYFTSRAFANAIITQVQSENSYTLSPGLTPEDRDFVEYFLFENHKGYCAHFASAAAALLRSAGIPARYVEGYAISPSDFKEHSEWANIPDYRTHAWVEIYLNAVGWVPVEATPGANGGIIDHEAAESEASSALNHPDEDVINDKFDTHRPPESEDLPDAEKNEYIHDETQDSDTDYLINAIIRILPTLVTLGLLTAFFAGSRKLQITLRNKKFIQSDRSKAAIEVYNYILNLYTYAGSDKTAGQKIPKDLYSLVLKARFSQHMLTEQELGLLLDYAENQALAIQKTVSPPKRFIGKYIYVVF